MQKLKMIAMLAFFTVSVMATGQNKVTESAILGTWKMTINSESVMEKVKEEADKEENLLAKVLLNSVGGMVDGVLRNLDIYIKFERGGDAQIRINAFDGASDEDKSEWYIKGGRLFMKDVKKGDDIDWDSDDSWIMKDGILYLDSDDDVEVYMVRMDK